MGVRTTVHEMLICVDLNVIFHAQGSKRVIVVAYIMSVCSQVKLHSFNFLSRGS